MSSCTKDKIDPNALISPSDVNALSKVLIMPTGTKLLNGQAPKTTIGNSINVSSSITNTISSNGSTAILFYKYSNLVQSLGGCYAQVEGASSFYNLPCSNNSGLSGQFQLPIGIPTNVDKGDFCVNFWIYDINNNISNMVTICISVLRLGTGSIQISLSWDNSSDQDLHVITPKGEEIYFSNKLDLTGGELDRDDRDGFGPENIFWLENAPDGTYTVKVKDYDGSSPSGNNFYVTVSSNGITKNFSGFTQNYSLNTVTIFTKNGNNIIF